MNNNEGLYEINLEASNELNIPNNIKVVPAHDGPKSILTMWMKSYDIAAIAKDQVIKIHQKGDCEFEK